MSSNAAADHAVLTLAIDAATPACSVALFENGRRIAHRCELVHRGHAEKLVPMVASLPGGGRAANILVDVGPGSFTGVRVGIAAARGLALGWQSAVLGYTSLSCVAARAFAATGPAADGPLAVVLEGGHGEVFMQRFLPDPLRPDGAFASLAPAAALAALGTDRAVGDGLRWLRSDDPRSAPTGALPDAGDAMLLPPALRSLPARPLYGRAPDAKLPAPR